jgi:ribosomal protein S12 methylthiotransferase accessory factor
VCRYSPNEYGIPFFAAYIVEPWRSAAVFACDGFGCHPDPRVALVRAVVEAAQSRLSHIHGGRDDIIERFDLFASAPPGAEAAHNERFEARITRSDREIDFDAVPRLPLPCESAPETLCALLRVLAGRGVCTVARAVLTGPEDPVAVVRVVVPTLESLNRTTRRVGRRLARYVELHCR